MSIAVAAATGVVGLLGSLFGGGGEPFVFQSPSVNDLKRTFQSPSLGDSITLFGPAAGRRVWKEYQCQELGQCEQPASPVTPAPEERPRAPSDDRTLADVLAGLGGGFQLPEPPEARVGLAPAQRTVTSPYAPILILVAVAVIGFYLFERSQRKAG